MGGSSIMVPAIGWAVGEYECVASCGGLGVWGKLMVRWVVGVGTLLGPEGTTGVWVVVLVLPGCVGHVVWRRVWCWCVV